MAKSSHPTSFGGKHLPAGTRLEEFIIERVLGSGGFGITYLANDTSLNRHVVIKENLPSQFAHRDTTSLTVHPGPGREDQENFEWSLENFSKEAAMLASLDHPGIVKVLRSFKAFGTAYFVMPFVEGIPLDQLMEERRREAEPFSEEELRGLLDRTLNALAHLHDRGIYHRDIKPGNILITNDGVPVLIDFGSARQRLSERSMTVVESAGYTPFEQLQSRGNVGPWSDLYALAATLVKVITGDAPPKANDRSFGDPWHCLVGIKELESRFSQTFLAALDRALLMPVADRWQDALHWQNGLEGDASKKNGRPLENKGHQQSSGTAGTIIQKKAISRPKSIGLFSAAAAAFVAISYGAWNVYKSDDGSEISTAPAPLVSMGGLKISSEPLAAEVKADDGKPLGVTPLVLEGLAAGEPWRGTLELEGYVPAEVEAMVQAGETKFVPLVKLTAQPQKVIVTSEPSDSEVLENDKLVGRTPWEGDPREVGSTVKFLLRKPGYEGAEVSGEVGFGKSLKLHAPLKASPQKVIVTSEPSGAVIWKGGSEIGITPMEFNDIRQTAVTYRLTLDGFEVLDVSGNIEVGDPLNLHGILVPEPKVKFERLRKDAEDGDRSAMWKLGICYDEGIGVLPNNTTAAFWYAKSAMAGDAEGMFLLGLSYELGSGNPPSPSIAKYWYKKAANLGHESSIDRLNKIKSVSE